MCESCDNMWGRLIIETIDDKYLNLLNLTNRKHAQMLMTDDDPNRGKLEVGDLIEAKVDEHGNFMYRVIPLSEN